MGTGDILLGIILQWTSIPSGGGGSNTLSRFMLQKPGYAATRLGLWLGCDYPLEARALRYLWRNNLPARVGFIMRWICNQEVSAPSLTISEGCLSVDPSATSRPSL